ncbi:MAG: TIGR03084 family metal-binding protein [Pseudomonadota bacterium]|nr:TIGR03084 family metal-binding protein [Pseudomonadota bacterium]
MYGYQVDEKKMLEQAIHFKEESDALYKLLINADKNSFKLKTQFKSWTINDVLYHLHVWNIAALLSLKNENEFKEFMQSFMEAVKSGNSAREYEKILSDNTEGLDLLNLWKETYEKISNEFAKSDPKKRVKWAGPDMSVRSSITARHMETWAHGQEIFDQLGFERIDTDRIKNIVVIGVNTFGWTYINRNLSIPEKMPKLSLLSPSNELWEWNEDNEEDMISGSATEFSQVVTQVRNINDTSLKVSGKIANEWMSIAQCFAGPPENPPEKGTRFTRKN